ncbi:DUF1648 domain-containing protein [Candidatus Aciduliprofundum boonei]|uniref:DUF1648 domain-containing protein n=1 Tax=Aciduliprofundum boonei (strain DSM 19572 / T469) TaxID=439481 RepID=D3T948_ACIB4|nr:DUF1648 domain-containing protein [Candidatus Aciduliprofundum boonei]ADD08627.1 protein of unknown function DUF1648 [Aciduliprofundum boonei T469]HII54818.1 DUF1648 domain-containing protein [Candidatus Aciduliprofundum boonei]
MNGMSVFLLIINVIYLISALLVLFLAPKIGPNPYFGFRIGYSFSSRKVWNKTNIFAGILMAIHALFLFPIIILNNIVYYIIALIVPLLIISIVGIIYASHKLEEERVEVKGPVKPIKPLETTFVWKYLGIILFLILLLMMLISYPSLPSRLAVHFDASGNPNGWSSKNDFYTTYIILAGVYLALLYFIIYAGKKYPVALHSGVMRIGKDTVFKATILSLNIVFFILMATFLWIYFYNISGAFEGYIATTYFLILTFIAAFVPIGYIIYRWKKERGVKNAA